MAGDLCLPTTWGFHLFCVVCGMIMVAHYKFEVQGLINSILFG
jgi:hypothetical protein